MHILKNILKYRSVGPPKNRKRKRESFKSCLGTKSLDEVIFNSRVLDNSNSSSIQNEMKIEVVLKDPRAIKIAKGIPIENRNEVIEKYIILGDMVTCSRFNKYQQRNSRRIFFTIEK